MDIGQLRVYKNWIGKTPIQIRKFVIDAGGWGEVFPKSEELPVWAHRIRNFFNQTPGALKRLPGSYRPKGYRLGITMVTLTGDAYLDPDGIVWYQMSPAGTVYHYPGKVNFLKKGNAAGSLQAQIPVFKFISPDGTDGSLELIVHNWRSYYIPGTPFDFGENTLGKVNEWTDITYRTEFAKAYEGSYNYSETVIAGFGAHEHRDIRPHEKYGGFYIAAVHPWTKIGERYFPAHAHQVMGRGA